MDGKSLGRPAGRGSKRPPETAQNRRVGSVPGRFPAALRSSSAGADSRPPQRERIAKTEEIK